MSGVLIIAEHRRGELRPVTLELVSAAQAGRRAPSDTVAVALIAEAPEALVPSVAVAGVDEIITVQVAARDFEPDTFEAVTHALIQARKPSLVLVPHSIDAFGYAAALAAKNRYGFATDVFRFEYQQDHLLATRGGYGQKVNVEVDFLRPAILNDEILVTAELVRLSGATILFKQTIRRDDVQLIDATTRVACLDSSTLKPRAIPKDLFTEWRNVE